MVLTLDVSFALGRRSIGSHQALVTLSLSTPSGRIPLSIDRNPAVSICDVAYEIDVVATEGRRGLPASSLLTQQVSGSRILCFQRRIEVVASRARVNRRWELSDLTFNAASSVRGEWGAKARDAAAGIHFVTSR